MLVLDGVPAAAVPRVWPFALPFIERALAEGGGHFLAGDVLAALERGEMQLWALWREGRLAGALVTEIVRWPQRSVCRLVLAGAEDGLREEWLPWLGTIEAWARAHGCAAIEIYGRPGWARLLPGARRRVVLEWNLDGKE
ncbi:MAG: hypothetical protein IRZ04_08250 [Rhodospirillales bacterium]|nr:hypothetical protein [Rhodospirillales bacterium]